MTSRTIEIAFFDTFACKNLQKFQIELQLYKNKKKIMRKIFIMILIVYYKRNKKLKLILIWSMCHMKFLLTLNP